MMRDDDDAPVKSPCVSVCQLDPSGKICMGCRRTIDEIAAWGSMTPKQQRAVLAMLPARRT